MHALTGIQFSSCANMSFHFQLAVAFNMSRGHPKFKSLAIKYLKMQDIHASLIKNLNMISSHEPNSFAKKSMAIRIPEIVKAVAKNGQDHLTLSQYESLMTLVTALQQNGKIIPLVNSTKCDDYEDWNELYLKELASKTWCNAPWFYAEAYCFRLILDLVGFFTSGIDPYKVPKTMEIESTSTWNHLSTALTASDSLGTRSKQLACLLQCCLWGNKADGCFQAGKNGLLKENSNLCEQEDLILVDDTQSVLDFLSSCQKDTTSIHFINDNSGAEMLMDLALADCLLTQVRPFVAVFISNISKYKIILWDRNGHQISHSM